MKPTMQRPVCPDDRVRLWFKQVQGMTVFTVEGRYKVYETECPNCKKRYTIRSTTTPGREG